MAFCNERLFKPTAVVVPSWPMNCWKALGPKCVVFAFLCFLEPYFAPNLTLNSHFLWKIREILNLSFFAPFDIFWDGHCKNELEIIKFIHKLVISLIIWCPWRSTGGRLVLQYLTLSRQINTSYVSPELWQAIAPLHLILPNDIKSACTQ